MFNFYDRDGWIVIVVVVVISTNFLHHAFPSCETVDQYMGESETQADFQLSSACAY